MPVLAPLQADPSAPDTAADTGGDRWLVHVGLLTAAIAFLLDQATKVVAETMLNQSVKVAWLSREPFIGWQLTYNPGGAFGFPAPSWFFLIVTVVVTVIVMRNLPVVGWTSQAVAYGLLLAGAVGNATDRVLRTGGPGDPRFLHGHVVDFVAWGSFPRFNVADIAITCGFALLLVSLWIEERHAAAGAA
jgi:signal peptidase II